MKKIFKSLLMSALVLTAGAFVACTENGEEGNKKFEGMPEIEAVADVEGVTFEGGVVEVTVTSNAPWTAEVSAEDVTLSKTKGNGDAVVNVTIPATTEAREISVVFTAVGYMEGIELTATSSVSLFQNATGKLTISNITPDVVGEGAEFSLKDVLVVAVGAEAYVIADETGSMIVYHKDNGRAVGEKININGQVTVYSNGKGSVGTPQFANTSVVEVVSTGNEVTYNPTVLDAATFDALLNATVAQEVQVTGTWEVSGNYVNLVVNGATNKGSIKYIATADYASFNGQDVIINGYFVGISASGDLRYINIMPYSVEADPNAPLLNVDKTEITFAATDGSSARQTFTATTNGLEGYELTWAIDNTEDFNLGKQLGNPSRTTLYVTPKAANTGTTKTATVTVTYSNGTKTITKSVKVLQEGATSTVYNLVTAAPADWTGEYVVGCTVAKEGSCTVIDKKYSGDNAAKSTLTYLTLGAEYANNAITVNDDFSAHMVKVAKIEGTNYYSVKYGDMYCGWSDGTGNSCAWTADAPTASTPDFQWYFEIDADSVVKMMTVTKDDQTAGKERCLQFNANAGQERFAIYKNTQKNLSLFTLAK
ncbi:MAG: BACON domain-containing protein [Alistipes sp.]|nr:BACON domain-containing protein [Alistipes sp.]